MNDMNKRAGTLPIDQKFFPMRTASQSPSFDFLGVPGTIKARSFEGFLVSYLISCHGLQVKQLERSINTSTSIRRGRERPIEHGGVRKWKWRTKVLFSTPHLGPDVCNYIRKALGDAPLETTGHILAAFDLSLTFVTDRAPSMPCF